MLHRHKTYMTNIKSWINGRALSMLRFIVQILEAVKILNVHLESSSISTQSG